VNNSEKAALRVRRRRINSWRGRRRRYGIVGIIGTLALLVGAVGIPSAAEAATGPLTVVSLTFDDGNADQNNAVSTLAKYKLPGTFYINSGFIGATNYLTRADLSKISANGNEIGGHTVSHPDLTTVSSDEAKRQVCNDRVNLTNWGFKVTSFAYPFASTNAATEAIVKGCGYNSGRMLGDIRSRFGCSDCDFAERMPPADPYYTQALDQVDNTWTLRDLQNSVTNAEKAGGGWVQFTFHHVCANNCDALSISPTVFAQFAAWLAPRAASGNTQVKTVGAVIGGTVKPAISGPSVTPVAGKNLVVNPGLETTAASGLPTCFMAGGYGTNTASFAAAKTPAHSGKKAESLTVTGYLSGDAKLLPIFDLGGCSPNVVAGHTYSMRTWYNSTAATQFAVYLRSSSGGWSYWTSSPWFAASSSYTQAVWTTPAIPAGMTGISFGLSMFNNGQIVTDDYSLYESVGAPAV